MKKLSKIIGITAFCLTSGNFVFAQGVQTGLTLGASLGGASTQNYDSSGIISNTTKTQGGAYGGFAVGYDLALTQNISLGVESGFYYGYSLASLKADGVDKSNLNQWNIPLLIVGKYTFNNGVNVFAKAGATYVHQQITNTDTYFVPGTNGTNFEFLPELAAGVGYKFTNGINIGGQLGYLFGSTADLRTSNPYHGNDVKVAASVTLTAYISYTFPI